MKMFTSGERRGLILLALILLLLGAALAISDRRHDRNSDMSNLEIIAADEAGAQENQRAVHTDTLPGKGHKEDPDKRVGRRKKSGHKKSGKSLRQPPQPRRPLDQPVN
ncbi:hypothetical protein [Duncaniella sp.]|uniref:hypothetical protein n=1 Tax=Duncaniella sp. TaxID=2518496 RepID=UPI0023D46289|nr:hypothetical protein [Duncaniella sp.]MDE5905635.1 hypothetical protein [Duncaniella sp.]